MQAKMSAASNVYYGPHSTNFAKVGSVSLNEVIDVIQKLDTWFLIDYQTSSGPKRGFVPMSKVQNASSVASSVPTLITSGGLDSAVNSATIKTGPGSNYANAGSVGANESLTRFDGVKSGYFYVEYATSSGTKRGYISAGQLYGRLEGIVAIAKTATNFYYQPGTASLKVGSVSAEEYVVLLEKDRDSDWILAEYNTSSGRKRGYATLSSFAATESVAALPNMARPAGYAVANSAQSVYFGPSTVYAKVGSISQNEIVSILSEKYNYTFIEYNTSSGKKRGFVVNGSLSSSGATIGTMAIASKVYYGPHSSNYASVGSVSAGEAVKVIGAEEGWLFIEYATSTSNKRGYVPASSMNNGVQLINGAEARIYTGYASTVIEQVSVYTGPNSVDYAIAGSVFINEGITVLSENVGDFVYIEFSTPTATKRGYIPKNKLSARKVGVLAKVVNAKVQVYAGPDTSYYNSGTVFADEYIVILNRDNTTRYVTSWYFVEFNTAAGRKRGYAAVSNNIVPTESAATLPTHRSFTGLAKAQAALTVYSGPSESFAKVGTISLNERISTFDHNAGEANYTYIEYGTTSKPKRGYVPAAQLQPTTVTLPPIIHPSNVAKGSIGQSGNGRTMEYFKIGNGPNVLAAEFGIHGFEDAWSADGEELYKIAAQFINAMATDDSNGLLSDWTVYIIPAANPDGILDGWTSSGPGRAAVTSGCDNNRSFDTGVFYKYNDKRNFNGNAPFTSPEATCLKNAFLSWKPDNGAMILLDVHGWLNQTLGDLVVGQYFDTVFGFANKSVLNGHGYVTRWAQLNGMKASLVELPFPSSPQDIVNRDFAGKFITSVRNMLQTILPKITVTIPPESITLSTPVTTQMLPGDTLDITATVSPSNASGYTLEWISSNENIATVEEINNFPARSVARITAHNQGGNVTITCRTTTGSINNILNLNVAVPATAIRITSDKLASNGILTMNSNENVQLGIQFEPVNTTTTLKDITWSAAGYESVLSITDAGVLTAVAASGTGMVTALVKGSSVSDTVVVNVNKAIVPVTSVSIDQKYITLKDGATQQLTCTVLPENATNKTVRWSSSDPDSVSINSFSGKVTAKKVGSAVITCTTEDGGKTDSREIIIEKTPVEKIVLNTTSITLEAGSGQKGVNATIYPSNATNQKLTWTSSNTNIVQAIPSGVRTCSLVAGNTLGIATVTCSIEGESAKAQLNVEVVATPKKIEIKSDRLDLFGVLAMNAQESVQLTTVITPSNVPNTHVVWSVSDSSIATITQNGLLTALAASGKATVIAQIADTDIFDSITVKINQSAIPLSAISVAPTALTFDDRQTQDVEVFFTPTNASNTKVTWSTSNPNVATVKEKLFNFGDTRKATVTPVGIGSATLTCTSVENSSLVAIAAVTVRAEQAQDITIKRTLAALLNNTLTIKQNETLAVEATIKPESAALLPVVWNISDTALLEFASNSSVSEQTGTTLVNVKGKDAGIVTLRATVKGTAISDMVKVKIIGINEELNKPTSIVINSANPMRKGDYFTVTFTPANTSDHLTWSISDSAIATIDPSTGEVLSAEDGTATISCATDGGLYASKTVTFSSEGAAPSNISGYANTQAQVFYGPDSSKYALLTTLNANQSVTILHQESNYYYIRFDHLSAEGQPLAQGYVSKSFISLNAERVVPTNEYSSKYQVSHPSAAYTGPDANYFQAGSVSVEWINVLEYRINNFCMVEYEAGGKLKRAFIPENMIIAGSDDLMYDFRNDSLYNFSVTLRWNGEGTEQGNYGHLAVDYSNASHIAPAIAVFEGDAVSYELNNGNGYVVAIKHTLNGKTFYSFYGHLKQKSKCSGHVKAGEAIGVMGSTGNSSAPHVHLAFTLGRHDEAIPGYNRVNGVKTTFNDNGLGYYDWSDGVRFFDSIRVLNSSGQFIVDNYKEIQ